MRLKKVLSVITTGIIMTLLFTGCAEQKFPGQVEMNTEKLSIVTTTFAAYDWVREITAGTDAEIILLGDGADIHNYKPSAKDIVTIGKADVFIYNGGESDNWVDDAIKSSNSDAKVLSFFSALGSSVKEEVAIEGAMKKEYEDYIDEIEYDEHVWLSLRNAQIIVNEIASLLSSVDENNKTVYTNNVQAYTERLQTLDKQYADLISRANNHVMVFADRFPFRYMADDYGLEYYAAFSGCSAETEVSSETVAFLASKVDENKLGVIYTIDGNDGKIAETVRDNTASKAQQIAVLNSMQSKQSDDSTYIKIMEDNLVILAVTL